MCVKVDVKELDNVILYVLDDIISRHDIDEKTIIENVKEQLRSKKIYEVTRIIGKSIALETVSVQKKYYLVKALYKETSMEIINPSKFFTDIDIERLEKFEVEDNVKNDFVEFKNCLQVIEDKQWLCVLTIGEIAKLYNEGRVNYDVDAQRESISKEFMDKTIVIPKTYTKKIQKIKNMIIEESYTPDEITFNLEEDTNFEFKNNNLTIHGNIKVTDGYNRSQSILQVLLEHPELHDKRVMEIRIINLSKEREQSFIAQKNEQTKISKRKIQSMSSKYESQIVNELNKNPKSELKGLIALDSTSVLAGRSVVGFDILTKSIEENFTIKSNRNARQIQEFLIDFFNEIYGIYYEEFQNIISSKHNNYKLHTFSFVGYIAIASMLYENDNWIVELESILSKIDFSKNNSDLKNILPINKKINKKHYGEISNYFKQFL